MKKLICGILITAICLTMFCLPAGAESALLGDLNQDRRLSVSDVVLLRSVIVAETDDEGTISIGDMDGDGTLTVSDVILLREAIVSVYYVGSTKVGDHLSDEVIEDIRLAYAIWYCQGFYGVGSEGDDLLFNSVYKKTRVTRYYGTYNGNMAVVVGSDDLGISESAFNTLTICGYYFHLPHYQQFIFMYTGNTEVVIMGDAYVAGLISEQDVRNIYLNYIV